MKHTLTTIALVSLLAACSSTKSVNPDEPIRNQKLSTNFTQDNIKIETSCAWYKPWKSDCEIVAIEATASTFTNGGSTVQVSEARKVARMEASANVAHFLNEDVTSNRVVSTVAKHIEKAQDKMSKGENGDSDMTDKEAKAINKSVRDNSNDTARTVTRTVNTNAKTILRGFYVKDEGKAGDQEVYVTIRWDKNSDSSASQLRKRFGN